MWSLINVSSNLHTTDVGLIGVDTQLFHRMGKYSCKLIVVLLSKISRDVTLMLVLYYAPQTTWVIPDNLYYL